VSGIKQVFSRLDKKFLDHAEPRSYSSGAACLLALIQFGKLTIANLGDCVGLLVSKAGRMTKLSVE
jgi:serine/threonine protein phosphatase PrpC